MDLQEATYNDLARACRTAELENRRLKDDLAAERQTATLNAETYTLKIRALEDMVEAEAEARREAEGECERLRYQDDSASVVGIPMLARQGRSTWSVLGEDGARFRLVLATPAARAEEPDWGLVYGGGTEV